MSSKLIPHQYVPGVDSPAMFSEYELVVDDDETPLIEGELVDEPLNAPAPVPVVDDRPFKVLLTDDPDIKRLHDEAAAIDARAAGLDIEFPTPLPQAAPSSWIAPPTPKTPAQSVALRVWLAEQEVFKATGALERAHQILADLKKEFQQVSRPPCVRPVI